MKKVVCNATPIISLASIRQLPLLEKLFNTIYIPEAVYDEIMRGRYPGYTELVKPPFQIKKVKQVTALQFLLNDLDLGEAETLLLAKEINADIVIIDERLGYKIAYSQGLNVIGTLSVLLMAKKQGLIPAVKPHLDDMILKGRWYSDKVYNYFLKSIGEL